MSHVEINYPDGSALIVELNTPVALLAMAYDALVGDKPVNSITIVPGPVASRRPDADTPS